MAAQQGNLNFQTLAVKFNPATDKWSSYIGRFKLHLEVNGLKDAPDAQKKAIFLTYCDTNVYEMAEALVKGELEGTSWDALQRVLSKHYGPTPALLASRFEFYTRSQREGEDCNTFLAELRKLSIPCQFNDTEDMIRDRIVLGLRDATIQKKLLAREKTPNLEEVMIAARAAESSNTSSAKIRSAGRIHATEAAGKESETSEESGNEEEAHQVRASHKQANFRECSGCGGKHLRSKCRFQDAICRRCERRGHIAEVCRAALPNKKNGRPTWSTDKQHGRQQDFRQTQGAKFKKPTTSRQEYANQTSVGYAQTHTARTDAYEDSKIIVNVKIEGSNCRMEVDSGSYISIISWETLKKILPSLKRKELQEQRIILKDYQGRQIPILGKKEVRVHYGEFHGKLTLTIVKKKLPSLLGREWFEPLQIKLAGIHEIRGERDQTRDDIRCLEEEFRDVFSEELGKYRGTPITFSLDPNVAPIRLKPRRVPFAIRPKVEEQLDKLIRQGILEPVDHAKWETPIVTPIKPDGSIRICADYKTTLNRALQQSAYPVPVVQHLLHSIGKGKIFAKLDLAQAYQQLPVDEATAEAQTIVTHRGAFKCKRLQFGISIAPGLFQGIMERLLLDIPGVVPYFDDVIIAATSKEQLWARLRAVLSRFQEAGLKLKRNKCHIGVPEVEFLGFLISASGISPTPSKLKAIKEAPIPKDKAELQAFLGLLNFYNLFLPQKATVAEPLHRLLDKSAIWTWGRKEAEAFNKVKALLTSKSVLMQYNETLPLTLTCDASPYGIGAVLSHLLPNGEEAPIAYFSKTLSKTQRNYSQIDKEALAAVAGVKRFHEYLYGRNFTLVTDHKPLLGILAGDKPTPNILSPRMLRWTVFLAAYSYKLIHKPGKSITNADALSRCPLPETAEDPAPATTILSIEADRPGLLTSAEIARLTGRDKVMARVLNFVWKGWPRSTQGDGYTHRPTQADCYTHRSTQPDRREHRSTRDEEDQKNEIKQYEKRQTELSVLKGCLLWGDRVIIPPKLRNKILQILHEGHPGIVKMKALARSYVWWPGIDREIETWVASCRPCQETRPVPPKAKPTTWEAPTTPWARIHIDFAGPVQGQTFLIVVDAYSKWLEVVHMKSTTSEATIAALRKLFATHGLPDTLVSDNGPQFVSRTFEIFLAELGIRHALSAPAHPATNGQAEIMVKLAKGTLKKLEPGEWQEKIDKLLFTQHVTPNTTTHRCPAELLMGRRLRTVLDRVHPSYSSETPLDSTTKIRNFLPGDWVYAQSYTGGPTWVPAKVTKVTGPRSYRVELEDGRSWARHVDQLRGRITNPRDSLDPRGRETVSTGEETEGLGPERKEYTEIIGPTREENTPGKETGTSLAAKEVPDEIVESSSSTVPSAPEVSFQELPSAGTGATADLSAQAAAPGTTELRRSTRTKKSPAYLQDYVRN